MVKNIDPLAFAHWIKGYQSFYEPIVRAWFEEQGYKNPIAKSVSGQDLADAATALESKSSAPRLSDTARQKHIRELHRRVQRGRIQLDMVAERNGLVIGEFKSWSGYSNSPTWKLIENEFVGENTGLFLTLRKIEGQPIAGCVLVLWKKSDEHEHIERNLSNLYDIPVRLFYLDEIFATLGTKASTLLDSHLHALDEAIKLVRGMVGRP